MNKAKEISALWSEIRPQIGKMINLCHQIESHTEDASEAYQRGYEKGFVAGHLKAEKSGQSFYEDGYKRGLADAWDAARKICLEECDGGMQLLVIDDIFNVSNYRDALKDYSASEAIEKIRQYEQEKDRQVRIEYNFDEIKDVLETTAKECNVSLDEIAEVLRKMKEADNG